MLRLCVNSRDELIVIDLDKVAFLQANGNYTLVVYMAGQRVMITSGISQIEKMIQRIHLDEEKNPFVRIGRSHIINQNYLSQINILKQKIILSDFQKNSYSIDIPKTLLKRYKELIHKQLEEKASSSNAPCI